MTTAEELDKLRQLYDDGIINDEQYERARAKLFDEEDEAREDRDRDERPERRPRDRDDDVDDDDDRRRSPRARRKKAREMCMILHLSLLAGHVVPLGGIIVPIVIWQTQKDELPEVDEHGKNAANWILSFLIYAAVSAVLCLVFIGFVLLPVVLILNVVFPIIAGVKANEGRVWKYPLAIPFFS